MNSAVKQIVIWVLIVCSLGILWEFALKSAGVGHEKQINISELMNDATSAKINDVTINGNEVTGHYKGGDKDGFHAITPPGYNNLYDVLIKNGVSVNFKDQQSGAWMGVLI